MFFENTTTPTDTLDFIHQITFNTKELYAIFVVTTTNLKVIISLVRKKML